MDESTKKQMDIAHTITIVTSSLSGLGSLLILTNVFRTKKAKRWSSPHQRFLFTISSYDFLMSLSFVFGRVPIPSSTGFPGAAGTVATCEAQVFLRHLGSASFSFSAALIVYYVLVVRYNIQDKWIAKWYEPAVHVICTGFYLATAILGLVLDVFNPGLNGCIITGYPTTCSKNPNIECTRGTDQTVAMSRLFFRTLPSLINFMILFAGLIILSLTVWTRRKKIQKYSFESSSPQITNERSDVMIVGETQSVSVSSKQPQTKRKQRRKSVLERQQQQVQIQCLLYAFSFTNSTIWEASFNIFLIVENVNDTNMIWQNSWLLIILALTFPLQGFWNFVIFFWPRFRDNRRRQPQQQSDGSGEASSSCGILWLASFWDVIWNPDNLLGSSNAQRSSSAFSARRKYSSAVSSAGPSWQEAATVDLSSSAVPAAAASASADQRESFAADTSFETREIQPT